MAETHQSVIDKIEHPTAEKNVLAKVLRSPDLIYDVSTELREEDFNNHTNQIIYKCMLRLSEKGVEPTIQNVLSVARSNGVLDGGGESHLKNMSLMDVQGMDLPYNIKLVLNASIKRKAYHAGLCVLKDCSSEPNGDEDISDFIGQQQQRFMDLNLRTGDNVLQLGKDAQIWVDKKGEAPCPVPGLPTGFPGLDEAIGGWRDGRMYVFGARSKVGKSLLLENFALNIAVKTGEPILYLDTEMDTKEDVLPRALSIVSGIDEDEINKGTFAYNPEKKKAVMEAAKRLEQSPFYHCYIPSFSDAQIVNLVRKYKIKYGIKALFFDYIKLPQNLGGSNTNQQMKEYQILGQLTGRLKDLSGELKIPTITAAQLNRSGINDKEERSTEPHEGMVGASDRILQNCSYLFFLWEKTANEVLEDGGPESGNLCMKIGRSRHRGEYKAWIKKHANNGRMSEALVCQ